MNRGVFREPKLSDSKGHHLVRAGRRQHWRCVHVEDGGEWLGVVMNRTLILKTVLACICSGELSRCLSWMRDKQKICQMTYTSKSIHFGKLQYHQPERRD